MGSHISIHIDADTPEEFQRVCQVLAGGKLIPPPPGAEIRGETDGVSGDSPAGEVPEAKPRGRPRKYGKDQVEAAIAQAKVQEESLQPEPEPAPVEEAKEATLDSLRAALQAYQAKHGGGTDGMAKVAELLKGFKAKRISEVKKEDYQDIIDACKQ